MLQRDLFAIPGDGLIPGLVYEPEFLSVGEEDALIGAIAQLPLKEAEYKQYRAKRRVQSYGGRFDYEAHRLLEAEPIAEFLHPLRDRIAAWTGQPADRFTQALVAEYAPGTQLGWHRDVPAFELIVGVSLGTAGTLRFRRYPPAARERSVAVQVAQRSIYRLQDEARWGWQHRVQPTPGLRYSITFRTLRQAPASGRPTFQQST